MGQFGRAEKATILRPIINNSCLLVDGSRRITSAGLERQLFSAQRSIIVACEVIQEVRRSDLSCITFPPPNHSAALRPIEQEKSAGPGALPMDNVKQHGHIMSQQAKFHHFKIFAHKQSISVCGFYCILQA
jgi:hypothetical protein